MKTRLLSVVAISMGIGAPMIHAAEDGRYYVGGSVGHVEFYDACKGASNCSSSDVGWSIYAGRRMSERVAIEAYYADLGAVSGRVPIPTAFGGTSRAVGARHRAVGAAVVGSAAITETRLAFIGRLGIQYLSAESSSGTTSDANSGLELAPGAGLELRLGRGFAARTEVDWFTRVHAYMLSVGLKYGF